jgi:hypothetical protein
LYRLWGDELGHSHRPRGEVAPDSEHKHAVYEDENCLSGETQERIFNREIKEKNKAPTCGMNNGRVHHVPKTHVANPYQQSGNNQDCNGKIHWLFDFTADQVMELNR